MKELIPILEKTVPYTVDLDDVRVDVDIEVYADGQWNDFQVTGVQVYNEEYDQWEVVNRLCEKPIIDARWKEIEEALDRRFG